VASIVHVPFCYFPDATGGTEVHVRELAREQVARGDRVLILAPADQARSYLHEGMPVERFTVSNQIDDLRDLYGSGRTNVDEFMAALERFRPDVLHVHGIGRAIAPEALRRARQMQIRVVLTYHTPTATCVRGTLLLHGAHPCDGLLDARRCTACTLTGHGVPAVLAQVAARAPALVGNALRKTRMRGRLITGLRTRELVTLRHAQTRELLAAADHIIAPAEWVERLLRGLGVPASKMTLVRQGIAHAASPPATPTRAESIRLVYLGRVEPAKGIHLLVRALRALPDAGIELHIYGVTQGDAHVQYRRDLRDEIGRDPRVVLHDAIVPDAVVPTIAQYDVLVAPSQQLETGPLVVLEGFAAGLPVVGSRLGGIAELVRDGDDGLLVELASVAKWAVALGRLLHEPDLLPRLRSGVRPPRSMSAVAEDVALVYRRIAA
jgi:glycosyltransferase involved in cell wall biosynthesis